MGSMQNNFIAVTDVPEEVERAKQVSLKMGFNLVLFSSVDALMEQTELPQTHFVFISATKASKPDEVAGLVQVVKQVLPDSRVLVVVDKRMNSESAKFIKKSGASLVLFSSAFHETSQLEYTCSQWIGGAYAAVKGSEFLPNTKMECTLHYLMPLNKKIVPFVPKGMILDEKRAEKLRQAQEVYIARSEMPFYQKYISENVDRSAAGLASRCRAQYLNFCLGFSNLIFLLIDQSEMASFDEGRALYDQCKKLAADLLTTLSSVGDAWLIVNNSAISDFSKVERSPAIACYAGLLSLMADIGKPEEIMIASLLADLGLLEMSPSIFDKQRALTPVSQWSEDQVKIYYTHPTASVNLCLSRKIALDDHLKKIIFNTHEQKDQKGFPNRPVPDKIPIESMLIQFCELIDDTTLVRMGEEKVTIEAARKKVIAQEFESATRFSLDLLNKIKAAI